MIPHYKNGLVYHLVKDDEIICKTTATCAEKAIEYFMEIGYDLYKDRELRLDVVKE
jgi:hypothetical protein